MLQAIRRIDMLRKPGKGMLCLTAVLLFASAAFSASRATVTMKTAVVLERSTACLADIATIAGSGQTKKLAGIVVARSLMPGQTRFVDLDYIRIRLKQAGFDPEAINFRGARDVRVTRRAVKLPAGRIEQAVRAAIRSRMPWKDENVTISDISFDDDIVLPKGRLTYRITPNPHEDFLGRTILALHLFVDGEPVRKLWVNANITVMAKVVTVVRPLGKYQHIEPADVALQRRDLSNLSSNTVRSLEGALGSRTTRMIYPNTVLESSMIDAPPLVRRGDVVKIVANAGLMTITATGMVKQQGSKGDRVKVTNMDSKRVITARVTGPGIVEVDF
jgi:flagellar basal body P-ring formation protein FlgA